MEPIVHEVDPGGDTLLILRYADAPFAVRSSAILWPDRLPNYLSQQMRLNEQHLGGTGPGLFLTMAQIRENKQEIRMRLSSKHLTLASAYFKKMMTNNWRETNPEDDYSDYSFVVAAEEWDQKALLILMNIIHGQTTKVPRIISLEMLAKMSVLVDYYKCHEVAEFFAKTWISNLTEPVPTSYGRNLLLRLCVSWVFSEAEIFRLLTKTVVHQSRGPIHSLDLPIPTNVIDTLEMRRQNLVSGVICSLHILKSQFYKDKGDCSFECSSILLGALIKGMNAACILDQLPRSQLEGYSFMALERAVLNIQEPNYGSIPSSYSLCTKKQRGSGSGYSAIPHRCTLSEKTRPIIDKKLKTIFGLELTDLTNED
ncbi:hypothetical protein PT974_07236 [Cladobotryum mycophilum]|uniref:BTB domain-containing protein n=1 Tax=Cladobotryum mycophilum TaxID=491253 RepID=A0ABR0SP32_9HYPO